MRIGLLIGIFGVIGGAGCGDGHAGHDGGGLAADMATAPDLAQGGACTAKNVPCTDQSILGLALFRAPSPANRRIANDADGNGFTSTIDAMGGGQAPTESYIYAKFTDTGLMKVNVSDEAAFNSMDWDIAFRRFVARLNSGVSGPSCVTGAADSSGDKYEDIAKVPDGLTLEAEAYYDDQCKLVDDQKGLMSPATVLKDYWKYDGCVQMTGDNYIVHLADGRHVKLTVIGYYEPLTAQKTCDDTGMLENGAFGGKIRVRWAFVSK